MTAISGLPIKDHHPDHKISEDGIYDLPIKLYHSNVCDGPSISSSGLRILANPDMTPDYGSRNIAS